MTETLNPVRGDELPKPKYRVLNKLVDEPDRVMYHVKLSQSHTVRRVKPKGKNAYLDTDHVMVGIVSLDREDSHGNFHYEETLITASDEDESVIEAILYLAPRRLTLEEAMFALGEI